MKRFLAFALAASVGLVFAGSASAETANVSDYTIGDAANGIGDSRHNLGSYGDHIITAGTSEICVFCHTPHHTNSTATDYRPLWNRKLTTSGYTAYGTTTAGTSITSVGGTTLACLGCHDGVTTFDNIVNAPGKKGLTSTSQDRNWAFWDNAVPGYVSDFITSSRLNIGLNLSNDHPMSVTYDSTAASLRPTSTTIGSIVLNGDLAASAQSGNLAQNKWAVKGYISTSATIADLLRGGKVECSSCHDPHFNNKSWDEVDLTYSTAQDPTGTFETNGLFLRRVGGNSGSGLCRTCHNK